MFEFLRFKLAMKVVPSTGIAIACPGTMVAMESYPQGCRWVGIIFYPIG